MQGQSSTLGTSGSHSEMTDETAALISSDKVEGTTVHNSSGEELGVIRNLMIDKRSGQVSYAVMSFGGFLGIGRRYHAVPWRQLTYDTNVSGYVVNLDRHQLENAPMFDEDDDPFSQPGYTRRVDDYYGRSI